MHKLIHIFSLFLLVLPGSHFLLSALKALLITVFIFISAWPLYLNHFLLPFNKLFKFSVLIFRFFPFSSPFPNSAPSLSYNPPLLPPFKFVWNLYSCALFWQLSFSQNRYVSPFLWPVTCLRLYFRVISFNFLNSSSWVYNCYIGSGPVCLSCYPFPI